MFKFDLPNTEKSSPPSTANSSVLTQNEIAEVIRIAETYSLSRAKQVKLLLLIKKRKKTAHNQSKHP